jgi:hypothetical protein
MDMKYRIYVDEVGNPDLDSSDNPNHRFLSLTGIIIDLGYVQSRLHPDMEELKSCFFISHPDEPIILHRKDIFNAKPPFENLKDEEIRVKFDRRLLFLLNDWEYTVVTVCIDKEKHKETYTAWRYEPYHYCLAVLLERFVFFLNRKGCKGDVMAESRGGKEDMRLKNSFSRLWENGTDYVAPEKIQNALTSKRLKVKSKANNVSGLQLADLIAHSSRNEILLEEGLLVRPISPFAKEIIQILQKKYYQQHGRTFGKKFL